MLKKIISLLLSAILLSACTIPAFAADSQANMSMEDLWQAYETRDFDRLHEYCDALGVNEEDESPTIAPRWESGGDSGEEDGKMCHQALTMYGFLWYLGAMQNIFGVSINAMGYTLSDLGSIITGSFKPDKDWIQRILGFSGHFYDPDTGLNYLANASNTARTNEEYYYQQAVKSFRGGYRQEAMIHLGWALHFLQDANEPHHATNKIAGPLSRHQQFEIFASQKLFEQFISDDLYVLDSDPTFFYHYQTTPVGETLWQAAGTASNWIGLAESTNETLMRICAAFTLGNAMIHSSGLLYKFAKETGMIR